MKYVIRGESAEKRKHYQYQMKNWYSLHKEFFCMYSGKTSIKNFFEKPVFTCGS
jgi:hypothetical protein